MKEAIRTISCPTCGRFFLLGFRHSIYQTHVCRQPLAQKRANRRPQFLKEETELKPVYEKTCSGCGLVFRSKRPNAKYCQVECYKAHRARLEQIRAEAITAKRAQRDQKWKDKGYPQCQRCRRQLRDRYLKYCRSCWSIVAEEEEQQRRAEKASHEWRLLLEWIPDFFQFCQGCTQKLQQTHTAGFPRNQKLALIELTRQCARDRRTMLYVLRAGIPRFGIPGHTANRHNWIVATLERWINHRTGTMTAFAEAYFPQQQRIVDVCLGANAEYLCHIEVMDKSKPQQEAAKIPSLFDTGIKRLVFLSLYPNKLKGLERIVESKYPEIPTGKILYAHPMDFLRNFCTFWAEILALH